MTTPANDNTPLKPPRRLAWWEFFATPLLLILAALSKLFRLNLQVSVTMPDEPPLVAQLQAQVDWLVKGRASALAIILIRGQVLQTLDEAIEERDGEFVLAAVHRLGLAKIAEQVRELDHNIKVDAASTP